MNSFFCENLPFMSIAHPSGHSPENGIFYKLKNDGGNKNVVVFVKTIVYSLFIKNLFVTMIFHLTTKLASFCSSFNAQIKFSEFCFKIYGFNI